MNRIALIEAALNEPPNWSAEYAQVWREFLKTPVGERLLAVAAAHRPVLPEGADNLQTTVLIAIGAMKGYERALAILLSLKEPDRQLKDLKEQYPGLDDEEAWRSATGPDIQH
jgi:hypothetical protein